MRFYIALYIIIAFFCFTACTKHDVCPKPPGTHGKCDFAQSLVTYLTDHPYTRTQYQKEYDENGRAVKVVAGVFGYGLRFTRTFQLRYNGSAVYFIKDGTTDTALMAQFDGTGRLQKMVQSHDADNLFLPVLFTYGSDRLAHIQIANEGPGGTSLYTKYDANGNIIKMSDSTDENFSGIAYTYDLSVTATEQFYSDDFYESRFNTQYLAEFLGWLPNLQPVNKRIGTAINDNPMIPHTNHVYDSLGRLVSYESGQDFSEYQLRFTNVWNCNAKKLHS